MKDLTTVPKVILDAATAYAAYMEACGREAERADDDEPDEDDGIDDAYEALTAAVGPLIEQYAEAKTADTEIERLAVEAAKRLKRGRTRSSRIRALADRHIDDLATFSKELDKQLDPDMFDEFRPLDALVDMLGLEKTEAGAN